MSSKIVRVIAAVLFFAVGILSIVRENYIFAAVFLIAAVAFTVALAKDRGDRRDV